MKILQFEIVIIICMHTFVFIDTILHKLILLKLQYVQRNTFCKFFFSLAHSYIVELLTGVMQLFNKFAGVDYALCIFFLTEFKVFHWKTTF